LRQVRLPPAPKITSWIGSRSMLTSIRACHRSTERRLQRHGVVVDYVRCTGVRDLNLLDSSKVLHATLTVAVLVKWRSM
jgi:hypothetical protein